MSKKACNNVSRDVRSCLPSTGRLRRRRWRRCPPSAARKLCALEHGLVVGIVVEGCLPPDAVAVTRLAGAAKACIHIALHALGTAIHGEVPAGCSVPERCPRVWSGGEAVGHERLRALADKRDRLVDVGDLEHGQQRSEDLLLHHGRLHRRRQEHGDRHPVLLYLVLWQSRTSDGLLPRQERPDAPRMPRVDHLAAPALPKGLDL
mmetsp:Transcript_66611/g.177403  ORF Transcript_66611/g.177403 Transcript_66611/m.177403 type:complete len:205 (-) Transcript_66611:695-1309(-)